MSVRRSSLFRAILSVALFALLASVLLREYAGLREELSRINVGEPGYQEDLEINPGR